MNKILSFVNSNKWVFDSSATKNKHPLYTISLLMFIFLYAEQNFTKSEFLSLPYHDMCSKCICQVQLDWYAKYQAELLTDLSNTELFNIIDSISSFRTFLEELIIQWFVWLNEKFFWIENNVYNYFASYVWLFSLKMISTKICIVKFLHATFRGSQLVREVGSSLSNS